MEYHCMDGSYYLSDLNTGLYPILSHDNNLSITISNDYKINLNPVNQKYTGFIVEDSNIPTKNGAIHIVNDILPVTQPEPAEVLFETTSFFDLQQTDGYQKHYMKWYDGENTFAKIHWEGDFLQYHYRPDAGMMNHDAIRMTGFWTLSVTFPKVMKGKYRIIFGQQPLGGESDFVVYLDGVRTPFFYSGKSGGEQTIAEATFTQSAEHTVKIRAISYGFVFWDYVKFVPMK